jgi:trafficking protein particle complex subunit 13
VRQRLCSPSRMFLTQCRLSRPSLVLQHPVRAAEQDGAAVRGPIIPASLAYPPDGLDSNPAPFLLTPALQLPPSFGSAYVGETFSCALCANHDGAKTVRDVRIEAEMKTPGAAAPVLLPLSPEPSTAAKGGVDLESGQSLQRVVNFDLKEDGNHVLAVTVSYYEATETSGRTRTFRKLYQFVCKSSFVVRTKSGAMGSGTAEGSRRWVLEAQLENCSEDVVQLERVGLDLEEGLDYRDCNWEATGGEKPVLHPGEAEQVCFVIEEQGGQAATETDDGRVVFGVLGIGWRSEGGNRGYLSTGKLGTKAVAVR